MSVLYYVQPLLTAGMSLAQRPAGTRIRYYCDTQAEIPETDVLDGDSAYAVDTKKRFVRSSGVWALQTTDSLASALQETAGGTGVVFFGSIPDGQYLKRNGTTIEGSVGTPGATGPQGATGATGAQGPIGNTGPQGPTGAQGSQGIQGIQGIQGVQGPSVGTSAFGYASGAGGTVTQLTSKSTGVTLSKLTGDITLNAASLAAAAIVSFTLTNTTIAATDVVHVQHQATGTFGAYTINARSAAGSAVISVRNNTAGALAEAIVIKFLVIKAVTA